MNLLSSGQLQTLLTGKTRLQDLFDCNSTIATVDGQIYKSGAVPDDPTISKLVSWLERGRENIVAIDDLPGRFSEAIGAYACGLLAARLDHSPKAWLIWLRFEVTEEVHWAGDPYKPAESTPFGDRLYPRTSFELWKEIKRGTSEPWESWQLEAAKSISELVAGLLTSGKVTA